MRRTLFLLPMIAMSACQPTPAPDRLAETYADLLLYRQRTARMDSMTVRAGIDSLLEAHGTTAEAFARSFAALADDHRSLPAFFSSVESRLAVADSARR